MKVRTVRFLSVLPLPLLALGSAHELYLRNQGELEGSISVLVPFWLAALLVVALGMALAEISGRRWARVALWAYHVAGALFLLYSFLRALPWQGHAAAWALDRLGAVPVGLAVWVTLVMAVSRTDPAAAGPPLAVFAITLLVQETWRVSTRLTAPLPAPEAAPPVLDVASEALPNVYQLVLDAFQPEIFDQAWSGPPPDGFVHFVNTRSLFSATIPSMTTVFTGCRPEGERSLAGALADGRSLPRRLAAVGYRTVAYVPPNVYAAEPRVFDRVVWHAASLPQAESRALHRWLFARMWLATVLPAGLLDSLSGRNALGFAADDMRSLRNQRVSVLTQPVTSVLSFERYLHQEESLPARGRYTLVHLLVPHSPFVVKADCSHGDIRSVTSELDQSRCAVRLVRRFLDRLDQLDRLRDSIVLIHSDHGSWTGASGPSPRESTAVLLIKQAQATGPGRRVEAPASLLDVAPTLLQLAGVGLAGTCEGRPLLATDSRLR